MTKILAQALENITDCFDETGAVCETTEGQLLKALHEADKVLADYSAGETK